MTETRLTKEIAETVRAADDLTGFTELDDAAAERLSKFRGRKLNLNGLTSLSDAAAESLSKCKDDYLDLDGLTSLSDAAAVSLSKHAGSLSLGGLTSLSDTAAESLAGRREGGLRFGSRKATLDLDGLTSLSDAAAVSLSKLGGSLSLGGLANLGLENLSDIAAAILRNHPSFAEGDEDWDDEDEDD